MEVHRQAGLLENHPEWKEIYEKVYQTKLVYLTEEKKEEVKEEE